MTKNKIKKKDIYDLFSSITIDKYDNRCFVNQLTTINKMVNILRNEIEVSLGFNNYSKNGKNLRLRSAICFNNCLLTLENDDFNSAWYELMDIIDYLKDDEYVSENEIVLLYSGLNLFIHKLAKIK